MNSKNKMKGITTPGASVLFPILYQLKKYVILLQIVTFLSSFKILSGEKYAG